jgi:hypothetical protein
VSILPPLILPVAQIPRSLQVCGLKWSRLIQTKLKATDLRGRSMLNSLLIDEPEK